MDVRRHGNDLPCRHMYANVEKGACSDMVGDYHVDTRFVMQEKYMRRHGMRLPCRHKFCYAMNEHVTTWYALTMSTQVDECK